MIEGLPSTCETLGVQFPAERKGRREERGKGRKERGREGKKERKIGEGGEERPPNKRKIRNHN